METFRRYGKAPYTAAVLHGGPGAQGSALGLARDVGQWCGTLEPMQTRGTVDGQVEELAGVLTTHAELPATIVGWSWGAMLGYILAARHPELVRKLVMVGSAVFEDSYAEDIMAVRLARLDTQERTEAEALIRSLADPDGEDKDRQMARFGQLLGGADTYDPIEKDTDLGLCSFDIHVSVWIGAQKLRTSGELLELGRSIQCPVVALHGDHDPHPADGVRKPLARVLNDFRFVLLEKCGHSPWNEREARDRFLTELRYELET